MPPAGISTTTTAIAARSTLSDRERVRALRHRVDVDVRERLEGERREHAECTNRELGDPVGEERPTDARLDPARDPRARARARP